MKKIKEWAKANMHWIALFLLACLALKSCQSCSTKQEMLFNDAKTEQVQDSLSRVIAQREAEIIIYKDSVLVLRTQLESQGVMIDNLNNDKKSYQKTIENLSVKEKKRRTE